MLSKPAPRVNAARTNAASRPLRSNRRSRAGAAERSSTATNAASAATPIVKAATIAGAPQPSALPRTVPKTRATRPIVSSPSPSGSSGRLGPNDSATAGRTAAKAVRPSGTLTRKIQRQPSPSVSSPPTSGPTARASPMVAAHAPTAPARRGPGYAAAISGMAVASSSPPPIPCTPRARLSTSGASAAAHAPEASVKTASPAAKTRRRPTRSASAAPVMIRPAMASV